MTHSHAGLTEHALQPMTLNALLRADGACRSPLSLDDVLGDGHFIRKSPIARRIRERAIASGYRFSGAPVGHSHVFSLLALAHFLRDKCIAYVPNGALLREMAPTLGELITSEHLVKIELGSNSLLHETAHGVAHERLFGGRSPFDTFADADEAAVTLRYLCAESYAQAVEVLNLVHFVRDDTTYFDLLVVKFNSFVNAKPALVDELRELCTRFGDAAALAYLFVCFLLHNFKQDEMPVSRRASVGALVNAICGRSDLSGAALFAVAPTITDYVFSFGGDFIHFTTPMFFRFLGMQGPYSPHLNRDPIAAVAGAPEIVDALGALVVDAVGS